MSLTQKLTLGWSGDGRELAKEIEVTADGAIAPRQIAVPDESVDLLVNLAIDYSQLKAIILLATVDMTIETNDGSSPDDTIALRANEPYVWHDNAYWANPFTADVTALYVTNASGAAGTLYVDGLEDASP